MLLTRTRGAMALAVAAVPAAMAMATCAACGSMPDPDFHCDACPQPDAPDAGVVLIESGAGDTQPADAGYPFIGDWGPLPGAPASCGVKIDYSPEKDITPFTWKPCASMRLGCSRLVVDWTNELGSQLRFPWHPARRAGVTTYLSYNRLYPSKTTPGWPAVVINVLADLKGQAVFADGMSMEGVALCATALRATPASGVLFMGFTNDDSRYVMAHFTMGQLHTPVVHVKTEMDFGLTTGVIQHTAAVGSTLYGSSGGPYSILLYEPLIDKTTLVGDVNGRIHSEFPVAVQGGAISVDVTSTRGIYFVALDGSFTKVYVPQSPYEVFQIDADNSSSDAFVWLQGILGGFDYTSVSIWTAPYTAQTNGAQAKRVTGIASLGNVGRGMVANAGAALLLNGNLKAEIVRLSDGWGWSIDSETEDNFSEPIWIDDKEAWISVGTAQTNGAFLNDIVRFDRSVLGPPTIPPN